MNKRQKTVGMLAVLLLVVAAAVFALTRGGKDEAPQAGNLLVNGDFSAVTDGMPDGWSTGMWVTSAGRIVSGGGDDGGRDNRRAGRKRRIQRCAV